MKKFLILVILFLTSLIPLLQAISQNNKLGLPGEIKDYTKWTRVNKKVLKPNPITGHPGYKDVYINKQFLIPFLEGTIIVKESRKERRRKEKNIVELTVMRKTNNNEDTGNWDFTMYKKEGSLFNQVAIDQKTACFSCHQRVADSDFVYTKPSNF